MIAALTKTRQLAGSFQHHSIFDDISNLYSNHALSVAYLHSFCWYWNKITLVVQWHLPSCIYSKQLSEIHKKRNALNSMFNFAINPMQFSYAMRRDLHIRELLQE